jgi:hypothetical protein
LFEIVQNVNQADATPLASPCSLRRGEAQEMAASEEKSEMDKFIARLNIENFREKLREGNDNKQREVLVNLLAEEEAKLQGALAKDRAKTKQA